VFSLGPAPPRRTFKRETKQSTQRHQFNIVSTDFHYEQTDGNYSDSCGDSSFSESIDGSWTRQTQTARSKGVEWDRPREKPELALGPDSQPCSLGGSVPDRDVPHLAVMEFAAYWHEKTVQIPIEQRIPVFEAE
jgi:hypothetical protein